MSAAVVRSIWYVLRVSRNGERHENRHSTVGCFFLLLFDLHYLIGHAIEIRINLFCLFLSLSI